jgi:type I restriction enzyme, S subunit
MTIVSKASAYPKSVQSGLPRLGTCPPGWTRGPLSAHLTEELRPLNMADDEVYDLVTVKRSRGGVVLREQLQGSEIAVKTQFRLKAGDFLISKRQIVHGACGIVPPELDGAIVSNEYSVLRARPTLDLNFLNCLAHSIYFQQTCFHSSIGVHVEKMIFKLDEWMKWDFDLPPLAEQHRIVEILATWDKATQTVAGLGTNAHSLKTAFMQAILTGRVRLSSFTAPWRTAPLGSFARLEKRKVDPSKLPPSERGIELEHIESDTGRLIGTSPANAQASLKTPFSPGDVLYGKLRPYLRKFFKPTFSGVCSTEIWVLKPNTKDCLPEYLHLLVQTPAFNSATAISSGSKMPRADWGVVSATRFALPPVAEQKAIAECIQALAGRAGNLADQRFKLRQERAALMQQLLTGKRRVNPSAEAA